VLAALQPFGLACSLRTLRRWCAVTLEQAVRPKIVPPLARNAPVALLFVLEESAIYLGVSLSASLRRMRLPDAGHIASRHLLHSDYTHAANRLHLLTCTARRLKTY